MLALSGEEHLLKSCGRALPLIGLRVVDEAMLDTAPGEPGELVVRGDLTFGGYWNDPEATAAAYAGGWLRPAARNWRALKFPDTSSLPMLCRRRSPGRSSSADCVPTMRHNSRTRSGHMAPLYRWNRPLLAPSPYIAC